MSDAIAQAHRTGIGGSGASIVWNVNPHRNVHDLYMECLGLGDEFKPSLAMDIGTHFEPFIRQWYEKKVERKGAATDTIRSKEYPWMIAHLDWISTDWEKGESSRFAEFKVAGFHNARDWGSPESCQVPLNYFLQGLHYSIVTGIKEWDLVVLLGTDIKVYPCTYDADLAAELIAKEKHFWHSHVLAKVPPPIDGSESCRQLLGQIYTKDRTPIEWAEGETQRLLNLYAEVLNNFKAEEGNKKELENKIRSAIGERAGLKTDRVKITWKARKDGVRVFRPVLVDEMEGVA
jgi:predicted phage-related endonuclease